MLKMIHSELAASAVKPEQYPPPRREIVLLGRSNVGKSSLINCLIQRKNLARTSSTPGKTRLLNFYAVEAKQADETRLNWYFVDLPGYGYAKVAKTEREQWLKQIERYLLAERGEKYCWQIVDIRHQPSTQDQLMQQILVENGFRLQVVANKIDKISKNARAKQLKLIGETLQVDKQQILLFSAETGEGREALLAAAENFLAAGR